MMRAHPAMIRGGWMEVHQSYSSNYLLSDTLDTRSSARWATDIRAGWDDKARGTRLAPFIGINNAFNHHYVSSVVITAAPGQLRNHTGRREWDHGRHVAGRSE